MSKCDRSPYERETFCGFNDEEDTAWVSTTSPLQHRRLVRRLGPATELTAGSWSWKVPKTWVAIRPRRQTSDAVRLALRERVIARGGVGVAKGKGSSSPGSAP